MPEELLLFWELPNRALHHLAQSQAAGDSKEQGVFCDSRCMSCSDCMPVLCEATVALPNGSSHASPYLEHASIIAEAKSESDRNTCFCFLKTSNVVHIHQLTWPLGRASQRATRPGGWGRLCVLCQERPCRPPGRSAAEALSHPPTRLHRNPCALFFFSIAVIKVFDPCLCTRRAHLAYAQEIHVFCSPLYLHCLPQSDRY